MRSFIQTYALRLVAACRRTTVAAVFASTLSAAAPTPAQDAFPTYSRTRMHAHDWRHRGDGHGYGRHQGYNNYYQDPYIYGPVVTGSYYQRPYPYHFDYYRHRWGQPHVNYGPEQAPVDPDCPCAVSQAYQPAGQPTADAYEPTPAS